MVNLVIDTHMKSAHTTYPIYVKKVNKIKIKITLGLLQKQFQLFHSQIEHGVLLTEILHRIG